METIAKPLKSHKKPLQTLERAMKSIAKSIHRTNGCAMLSIALAMVCNGFHCFFKGFCSGFHCSAHCFCNGFVVFSLVLWCFHSLFHGLQWFSLFSQWFYCGLLWFSMISQWFSLLFQGFAMICVAFSMILQCFSLLFQGFAIVFNCFFNDFAMVSIAFNWKATKTIANHWKTNENHCEIIEKAI